MSEKNTKRTKKIKKEKGAKKIITITLIKSHKQIESNDIHNYEYVVTCNKGIPINNKGTTDVKTTTSLNTYNNNSSSQGMTPAQRQDTPITKIIIIIKTITTTEKLQVCYTEESKWDTP
jgi:hypothetical protein